LIVAATLTGTSAATQATLNRHLQAFLNADVDALVRDFAEDGIVFAPEGTFRGRDQIRAFFERIIPMFPAEGTTLTPHRQDVDGEVAYISWSASTPMVDVPGAVDTFIIRNDQVAVQTFGGHIVPK
jgi:ketosteroid isomerase-like protein